MDKDNQSKGAEGGGAEEDRRSLPPDLLRRLRVAAVRLERYSVRVQNALAQGDRQQLYDALADVAEAHEIARRLSKALVDFLAETPS